MDAEPNGHPWLVHRQAEHIMASFEREKQLVEYLLRRLNLGQVSAWDPNADGSEAGMDILVHLADGRVVGIQVTEIDPHTKPGTARSEEKRIAGMDRSRIYFGWGQNDAQLTLESLVRTIKRKVEIAATHSFESVDEVWLLVCGGIPEHGAAISTLVMTPWLSAAEMGQATDRLVQGSKYDCCFFLPILGVEQAFRIKMSHCGRAPGLFLDGVKFPGTIDFDQCAAAPSFAD
jgi:hypothetical protein